MMSWLKSLFRSSKCRFQPEWKEQFHCFTPWGDFTVTMTMGVDHVYFPDEATWKKVMPAELHDKWQPLVAELRIWCHNAKIPLTLERDAWIHRHVT